MLDLTTSPLHTTFNHVRLDTISTTIAGDMVVNQQTNNMNESFSVCNIKWHSRDDDNTPVPTLQETVVPHEELDINGLPSVDAINYEAELEWMVSEHLYETYGFLPSEFKIRGVTV